MVKVVKELVKLFASLYWIIYIDCFYMLIELVKVLDEMSLYMTGIIMQNRLPKDLHITKSSKAQQGRTCVLAR